MAYSDSVRYIQPENVLLQELGEEAVLLSLSGEAYYGLDQISLSMYKLITTSRSIKAAYEALLTEYDVPATQLEKDLEEFLSSLLKSGLVTRVKK